MSLNIVFMGTPEFAVKSLESIINAGHKVLAAVVQPDKPKGRGMTLIAPPVKVFAMEHGIDALQPERIKTDEFYDQLVKLNPDIIVVVAYGKILPKSIIDLPRLGCINVHGSLLPKYRGAAPIQWAIINGEKTTGITTMYMDEGLDTGDMILKKEIEIEMNDTFETLHDKMAVLGGQALVETLELIENKKATRTKQGENFTYASILEKEHGLIDWNKSAVDIRNLVRGLNPWPGAYTFLNNCLIKIWNVEVLDQESCAKPSEVIQADCKNGILVAAGKGVIKILDIQEQCCKRMSASQYVVGHDLKQQKFTSGEKNEA
jgi:methionyl-tRNA formyltransferase